MSGLRVTVVDAADAAWQHASPNLGMDPSCSPALMLCEASHSDARALVIDLQGDGWAAAYPVLLHRSGDGRWLARTPDLGGPWLRDVRVDARSAAEDLRRALDQTLQELNAVSEVALLSPWVPNRDAVLSAWQARAEKQVCIADLGANDESFPRLASGRRSDIRRAQRELDVQWKRFTAEDVPRFASAYEEAMERLEATARWRRGVGFFACLASSAPGETWLCAASGSSGSASALFHVLGRRACYLFAMRSGDPIGGPSAVVWRAREELSRMGVLELMLGGGTSTSVDDSLLRFKRSLAERVDDLYIAGRAFDVSGHEAAVALGNARPLP